MDERVKNIFIKIGSTLVLIFGILFFICLAGLGVYLIMAYSDGDITRKSIIVGAIFIIAIIELMITIAIYEGLSEVVHLEKIEEQLDKGNKWTGR